METSDVFCRGGWIHSMRMAGMRCYARKGALEAAPFSDESAGAVMRPYSLLREGCVWRTSWFRRVGHRVRACPAGPRCVVPSGFVAEL